MSTIVPSSGETYAREGGKSLGDDRWLLAKRISSSTTFARSQRLAHLLLYLCERDLSGQAVQLTEQRIAADVFGRKGRFDPAVDTIVRSHTLRLRQKLEMYFQEEGVNERLRISIPKGGYVPAFEQVQTPIVPSHIETPPVGASAGEQRLELSSQLRIAQRRLTVAYIALGLLCILLVAFWLPSEWSSLRRHASVEHSEKHRLWGTLFRPGSTTILVAADSGLVMLHGATSRNSTLSEYLTRDFSRELAASTTMRPEQIMSIASRRYTSFVDLELFDRFTHIPEAVSRSYKVRYARDLLVSDLKNSNAILSGSQDANPWVELFEPQMNFVLQDDLQRGVRAFVNRKPLSGEQNIYTATQSEYGVLAYLPNLSGTGDVLIVEGSAVAGTQAVSDFLFVDGTLEPFLQSIKRKDGSLPHFEVLLASSNLNGSASRSQIIAYRIHPS